MTGTAKTKEADRQDRRTPDGAAAISLTAVVVAVTEEVPRVLVARRVRHQLATAPQQGGEAVSLDSPETLPYGPFDPDLHRTLELGLTGWVEEQTGLELNYVEQLYTFGNAYRDARELRGGPRLVSVAYLALTHETPVSGTGEAEWRDWYAFFPWEDWREGRPAIIDAVIRPQLQDWIKQAPDAKTKAERRERVELTFGSDTAAVTDSLRTLERFELLYEAELVIEALRDRQEPARLAGKRAAPPGTQAIETARLLGQPMALDNRRILATALGRLRGKLTYRPVVFELLPEEFTLLQLQRVVEALGGRRLHKQNFRRMVLQGELVMPVGRVGATARGRPAELYRFRREVVLERPSVGVGLPSLRAF